MDWFVSAFIRSSLVWLGLGVLLGVGMALWPGLLAYRAAHMHANLLGFVSMMIFGVAYHVLPRFTGRPLHAPRLAGAHLWIANAGLVLLTGGWIVRMHHVAGVTAVSAGAVVSAVGAFAFIYNIWRTLGPVPQAAGAPPLAALRPRPGGAR